MQGANLLTTSFETRISRWLIAWVDGARRNSGRVIAGCMSVTVAAAIYAALFLGINSDNVRLISEDLPSRQNHEEFAALFPNLDNALLVIVDGETPERARAASRPSRLSVCRPLRGRRAAVPGRHGVRGSRCSRTARSSA